MEKEFGYNEEQTYDIYFRKESLKFFRQGIGKYTDKLKQWRSSGNKKIEEIIDDNAYIAKWLEEKINTEKQDWQLISLTLEGKHLKLLKSTLPLLLSQFQGEKEKLESEGAPEVAYEETEEKIKKIQELMVSGIMKDVPILELLKGRKITTSKDVSKKGEKIIKKLKNKDYWVESRFEGKDEHLFIGERNGKEAKVHLILDRETGEIRIDRKDLPPSDLLEEVYTVAKIKGGPSIKKTKTTLEFIDDDESEEIKWVK